MCCRLILNILYNIFSNLPIKPRPVFMKHSSDTLGLILVIVIEVVCDVLLGTMFFLAVFGAIIALSYILIW